MNKEFENYKKVKEEIGIDPLIIIEGMKNGVWVKGWEIEQFDSLTYYSGLLFAISHTYFEHIKEEELDPTRYGIDWALTREELVYKE